MSLISIGRGRNECSVSCLPGITNGVEITIDPSYLSIYHHHHLTIRREEEGREDFQPDLSSESKLDSNITLQGREKKKQFPNLEAKCWRQTRKFEKKWIERTRVHFRCFLESRIKHQNQEDFFRWKIKKKNRKTYPKPAVSFQIPLEEFYREIKIEAVDRLATSRRTPPRSNLKGETHAAFTRYVVTLDAVRHPGEYRPPRLLGHRGGRESRAEPADPRRAISSISNFWMGNGSISSTRANISSVRGLNFRD